MEIVVKSNDCNGLFYQPTEDICDRAIVRECLKNKIFVAVAAMWVVRKHALDVREFYDVFDPSFMG